MTGSELIINGIIAIASAFCTYIFYYKKILAHNNKQQDYNAKQLEFYYQQLRNATLVNLSSIVQVERSIGGIKTNAFRFHGITEDEIKDAGLTKEELAYLVASFTAGRIYDACVIPETSMAAPLETCHYRYKMLAQAETRKAWTLIARMMTGDSYIKKLELTIGEIENIQTHR